MSRTRKPKVGDWVIITKSKVNWALQMNAFVGLKLKIKSINNSTGRCSFYNAPKWMNDWSWRYNDGHFDLIGTKYIYEAY